MKKLVLPFLIMSTISTFAQDGKKSFLQDLGSRLSFGLTAGGSYTQFYHSDFNTDPMVGFHGGAFVQLKMSEHLDVVEDFLYSQEGAKSKSGVFRDKNIKLTYINVPVVFRYKSNIGLFIEAGSQTGIKIKEDFAGVTNQKYAKSMNIGLVGGLGFQVQKGLGVRFRYIYGLTGIGNADIPGINNDFKSSGGQASLFYTF